MTCRICLEEDGDFIQPCHCKGTSADVHPDCLIKWLEISGKTECEICKHEFNVEDVTYFKCVVFPRFIISNDPGLVSFIQLIGAVFFILLEYLALFDKNTTEEVFFGVNIFQLCAVSIFTGKANILNTLLLWKSMSSITMIIAAKLHDDFFYAAVESGITILLAIFIYVKLVMKQSRQTVRLMIV